MTCTYIISAAAQTVFTVAESIAYIHFTAPALRISIGGFKMKQVICDICGKNINGNYTRINFPHMFSGYIIQNHDDYNSADVCPKCAIEYYELTEKFRKDKKDGETK